MKPSPSTNKAVAGEIGIELHEIRGVVPNLRDSVSGCAFADRCVVYGVW